jgi:GNAT superfamily N-acetyltransferase
MKPRWRAMRADDLSAVKAVSDIVHRDLPERIEVLADKRALFPAGAFVLERSGALVGYALAHPFPLGALPALDTTIGAPPAGSDCLYLHDIALLPFSRGHGAARDMVDMLADVAAAHGLRALALTSVYGTEPFWRRCGFVAAEAPEMADKLASYGGPAAYMVRRL